MAKTDGRKLVVVATAAIVGVIGVAQVYLPFVADRDKLRGLSEEEQMPGRARQQMEQLLSQQQQQQQAQAPNVSNSMWSGFKK